jgi:hypothetical protein
MNKTMLALVGVAGWVLWASTAGAATVVDISVTVDGNPTQTFNGISGQANQVTVSQDNFSSISVTGTGNPPLGLSDLLLSQTLDAVAIGGGTATIAITETGLSAPLSTLLGFQSSFTSNLQPGIPSVTETTYFNANNTAFGTGTLLSLKAFSGIGGTDVQNGSGTSNNTDGLYSLTEVYTITATGAGNANATIDISALPLPAALPLFASAFFGFGAWRMKARKSA